VEFTAVPARYDQHKIVQALGHSDLCQENAGTWSDVKLRVRMALVSGSHWQGWGSRCSRWTLHLSTLGCACPVTVIEPRCDRSHELAKTIIPCHNAINAASTSSAIGVGSSSNPHRHQIGLLPTRAEVPTRLTLSCASFSP
jgi:hypothetical protein